MYNKTVRYLLNLSIIIFLSISLLMVFGSQYPADAAKRPSGSSGSHLGGSHAPRTFQTHNRVSGSNLAYKPVSSNTGTNKPLNTNNVNPAGLPGKNLDTTGGNSALAAKLPGSSTGKSGNGQNGIVTRGNGANPGTQKSATTGGIPAPGTTVTTKLPNGGTEVRTTKPNGDIEVTDTSPPVDPNVKGVQGQTSSSYIIKANPQTSSKPATSPDTNQIPSNSPGSGATNAPVWPGNSPSSYNPIDFYSPADAQQGGYQPSYIYNPIDFYSPADAQQGGYQPGNNPSGQSGTSSGIPGGMPDYPPGTILIDTPQDSGSSSSGSSGDSSGGGIDPSGWFNHPFQTNPDPNDPLTQNPYQTAGDVLQGVGDVFLGG
jgi:hypothetical protein